MDNAGGLMGVVTTGAGIVIMTGIACHTMRMVDRSMNGMNRHQTSYKRAPARTRTSGRTSSRRSYSRRR